jgi:hypothetical protein
VSCSFVHDDAAYVLGALSPVERLEFEKHLASCADCTRAVRELAGIPGLLGRVGARVLEDPPVDAPVPGTLLPALSRKVRRSRLRRTLTAVGLAAAAAVIAPVVAAQLDDRPAAPTPSATPTGPEALDMAPLGEVPVRASVTMEQVLWGTKLGLTCTYDPESVEYELPPTVDYVLFVRTDDGRTEQVGSWTSVDGRTLQFAAGTATDAADIASVEVRTPDGRVVLELAA